MIEYDNTTISDTQPRKNTTTMGKVDTFDLMMIIRWVMNIFFQIQIQKLFIDEKTQTYVEQS